MTQILATATWNNIDLATLFGHIIHNRFFDNPDCHILDADLTDRYVAIRETAILL